MIFMHGHKETRGGKLICWWCGREMICMIGYGKIGTISRKKANREV